MRKSLFLLLVASFTLCLLSPALVAENSDFNKNHDFKLTKEAVIAGKTIEPGSYQATLSEDGILKIFRGDSVLVETLVNIRPLGPVNPNSMTFDREGVLHEVRFNEQKVVFPTLSIAGRTAE